MKDIFAEFLSTSKTRHPAGWSVRWQLWQRRWRYIYIYIHTHRYIIHFGGQVLQCINVTAAQCPCWDVSEEAALWVPWSRFHFALLLVPAAICLSVFRPFKILFISAILLLCSGTVPVVSEQRTNSAPVGNICVVVPACALVTSEPTSPLAEPVELSRLWNGADLGVWANLAWIS